MIIPHSVRRTLSLVYVAAFIAVHSAFSAIAADWKFDVKFTEAVHNKPYTGRVYLFFSKSRPEPRKQWWFFNLRGEPCASIDVENWMPGEVLTINSDDKNVLAFPGPPAEMKLDGFRAQAVVRFNPLEKTVAMGEGNGYSQVVTVTEGTDPPVLVVDQLTPPYEFRETRWVKLLKVRSKLLSEFHGREMFMHAAVMLPASYHEKPDRKYPTIYEIPGFGGTHHYYSGRNQPIEEDNKQGVEFLRVLLDPSCPLGHHVFADSANNGPVGQALIAELIPAFEKQFRSIPEPSARFLTGHSSGGWSSLWLQVTYPDFFGGTWSTAPDPVDFRDFQRINLYHPGQNMYLDESGRKRPLARNSGRVIMHYKDFDRNEWVLGHGGQLHSFEAVFSPRGEDGKPLLAWDRKTGVVNTTVANTWVKYDIRLILERNWKTLGPKLKGKLHVFMGDEDTFYLEGATILLKKSMAKLNTDAVVEIHPGKSHGSLMTRELRDRIRSEMVEAFLKEQPQK